METKISNAQEEQKVIEECVEEPLNLSVSHAYEDQPRNANPHAQMSMDAHLRQLENMSQYLLQGPSTSTSAPLMDDGVKLEEDIECENEDVAGVELSGDELQDGGVSHSETEVMRAARALFSKRTRTLYHWMYPDTPKLQLKAVVANAWDSMLPSEKQFYVSQVLGKFGCLQSQLMVNPQLGIFATAQSSPSRSQLAEHQHKQQLEQEQQQMQHQQMYQQQFQPLHIQPLRAPRVYMSEAPARSPYEFPVPYASQPMYCNYSRGVGPIRRRRGRPRGSSQAAALQSIYVQRLQAVKRLAEAHIPLQLEPISPPHHYVEVDEEVVGPPPETLLPINTQPISIMAENEFTDDPELRNELEKFQWTLHMVE